MLGASGWSVLDWPNSTTASAEPPPLELRGWVVSILDPLTLTARRVTCCLALMVAAWPRVGQRAASILAAGAQTVRYRQGTARGTARVEAGN